MRPYPVRTGGPASAGCIPPTPPPPSLTFPLLAGSQKSLFVGSAPEVFKVQAVEALEGCQR